jgi:hypothetical protein
MFRVLLSFLLTAFLFMGIISTTSIMFASNASDGRIVTAQVSEKKDSRQSIKEIEVVTSASNYHFTSVNVLR